MCNTGQREVVGLMAKIPGLHIPFKGDLGLICFAVSAVPLVGVSVSELKRSFLRDRK
jgi:hypothetical protein